MIEEKVESSLSAESDGEFSIDLDDDEYGEQTLEPRTVTEGSSVAKHEFYKANVRRQNCCFGFGMLSFAGVFVAVYFSMGLSFTPSNIGIFGDVSTPTGTSGEVGLDAANAETQMIVDEEIMVAEKEGLVNEIDGKFGAKAAKAKNNKFKALVGNNDHVGHNEWVEQKDWWKKHSIDESQMTEKEQRKYHKAVKKTKHLRKQCRKHPDLEMCSNKDLMTDLEAIREKLMNHYNYAATGEGKENSPEPKQEVDRKKEDDDEYTDESTVVVEEHSVDEQQQEVVQEIEQLEGVAEEVDVLKEPEEPAEPVQNSMSTAYTVLSQVPHDSTSFTQGLSYGSNGKIYETTGIYGQSKIRVINSNTFEVERNIDIDRKYFGEGSAFFTDKDGLPKLIEISWKSQTAWIYDASSLETLQSFTYTTTTNEGWGITFDPSNAEFIVSDGSSNLHIWDRDTFKTKRQVSVTRFNGEPQADLNELEFMDGLVCCNIWHVDQIICVDPYTGESVREYDMSSLWPASERGSSENVLNGIAVWTDHILLTGKNWDRMYLVTFPDWPSFNSATPRFNSAVVDDSSTEEYEKLNEDETEEATSLEDEPQLELPDEDTAEENQENEQSLVEAETEDVTSENAEPEEAFESPAKPSEQLNEDATEETSLEDESLEAAEEIELELPDEDTATEIRENEQPLTEAETEDVTSENVEPEEPESLAEPAEQLNEVATEELSLEDEPQKVAEETEPEWPDVDTAEDSKENEQPFIEAGTEDVTSENAEPEEEPELPAEPVEQLNKVATEETSLEDESQATVEESEPELSDEDTAEENRENEQLPVGAETEDVTSENVEPEEEPETPAEPALNSISTAYTVMQQVPHDSTSFTQGLSYGTDGYLYETTGLKGQSKVRRINPASFEVELSVNTRSRYFGEGSTYFTDKDGNGRIIEITLQEQTGFIYHPDTLALVSNFKYTTTAPNNEGGGITFDPAREEFVVSDGSSNLHFWNRDTLEESRPSVNVTRFDGEPQAVLNELEFMDGLVCCNVWPKDEIVCADPMSGRAVREYDMSSLWPAGLRGSGENVLNGIALGVDHVLLTGKNWDRMYKVHFEDWPTLFVK